MNMLAGNSFAGFFESRGKSKRHTLLAVGYDEHQNAQMFVYYIGEDTLVGIVCGANAWVSSIQYALFEFGKGTLAALIEKAKAGEVIDVQVPVPARKKLEVTLAPLRKVLLKHREVTHG